MKVLRVLVTTTALLAAGAAMADEAAISVRCSVSDPLSAGSSPEGRIWFPCLSYGCWKLRYSCQYPTVFSQDK